MEGSHQRFGACRVQGKANEVRKSKQRGTLAAPDHRAGLYRDVRGNALIENKTVVTIRTAVPSAVPVERREVPGPQADDKGRDERRARYTS
jgi:hypothetical protein